MKKAPDNWDTITELDEILVPTSSGYKSFNVLNLLGFDKSILVSNSGFGMAPLHFITQRGPFQDGRTTLDMRWDVRTIQIVISESFANRSRFFDRKQRLLDLLRPNRSFGSVSGVQPLIYRKWFPGGKIERGTDLITLAGSATVTSVLGKFVTNGLQAGQSLEITSGADIGVYEILEVVNDYTLILDSAMAGSASNVHWKYTRANAKFDLFCLVEQGPQFNESADGDVFYPSGYKEVIRFIADDPFWYGVEQNDSWVLPTNIGDLVFDGEGAWLGITPGIGRWLFALTAINESIDVVYWGTEFATPTIEIDGPATNPIITNTTINVSINLTHTIALGETVTIDLKALTVTDNLGNNLYSTLNGDIASFGLFPEPQAPDRINSINVSITGTTSDTALRLIWRNKMIGI